MISGSSRIKSVPVGRLARHAIAGLAALIATGAADPAGAVRRHDASRVETVESRPAGTPLMAIVSLGDQRVTIYDADGWILRAPVSSGQAGYETPAGIYSVLQKEAEHYSNLYDDASMPFMQRITWSGIALHGGSLPGYPASHGCVRMPYEFAERLFDMTKIGMRVIVARDDIAPADIDHPLLFKPKPVRADIVLETLSAYWEAARPDVPATTADADPAGVPSPADSPPPLTTLKALAGAKSAEAEAAAKKAAAARLTAMRMTSEAARLLRVAQVAKFGAEAQLAASESALKTASSPAATEQAEGAKAEALARLADAEAQLVAAKAEAQPKTDAAARARQEAMAADVEKVAALQALDVLTRTMSPVSVFISRKTQRLYIRQGFQPVLESPVTIRDADQAIGTHIYTVLGYADGGAGVRWSAVSMDRDPNRRQRDQNDTLRQGDGDNAESRPPDAAPAKAAPAKAALAKAALAKAALAKAALDRIDIPHDVVDRISEVISPGSSLIVSDEGISPETGKETDFVIVMSGEPQGGLKIRRHDPEAQYRYGHPYDHYGRSPSLAPSWFGGSFFR